MLLLKTEQDTVTAMHARAPGTGNCGALRNWYGDVPETTPPAQQARSVELFAAGSAAPPHSADGAAT